MCFVSQTKFDFDYYDSGSTDSGPGLSIGAAIYCLLNPLVTIASRPAPTPTQLTGTPTNSSIRFK